MHKTKLWLFPLLLLLSAQVMALPADKVIPDFNGVIQFDKISADYINQSSKQAIDDFKTKLEAIYKIKKNKRTFENTVLAYDNAFNDFRTMEGIISVMANAHPDKDTREAANNAEIEFGKFYNELNTNEDYYKAFKDYSETDEAKSLTGYKEKYLRESIRDFERNGFALSKEKRDQLKEINDRLSVLENTFAKNIAEYEDYIIASEEEVKGLDDAYKNARRQPDGTYKIDLTYPSYRPFMRLSESNDARKALSFKYNNRAADKNLVILEKALLNRQEKVDLLGYKTFAQYVLETRMAQNPETVWNFENGLIDKAKEKARIEYDEVLQVKREKTGNDTASVVNSWEYSYYDNIRSKEKYQVDSEKVKEYFEINNVMDGLFKITQSLFGLQYEEVKDPSVWHKDVRLFNVMDNGELIGRFYLDLYPRDNKFKHAACFGIVKGKRTDQGYQIPVASLECNFPQATATAPGLMSHSEVETFFHEFGHVLHNMLTEAELAGFSGTSVSRDFVEAPSQIFENWTWDYDALKLFARHYKTGEVLPKELFDKMLAAKNVGSGSSTLGQVWLGSIDMTLHDKYNVNETRTTTDIVKELRNKIMLTPYEEGTHFQAAFGHLLGGYGAGYYGYLWSEVYAQDMFSVFNKEGILNPEVGKRYRDNILAKGANREPIELVKEFLQREPNADAFYKSLGLEEQGLKEAKKTEAGK